MSAGQTTETAAITTSPTAISTAETEEHNTIVASVAATEQLSSAPNNETSTTSSWLNNTETDSSSVRFTTSVDTHQQLLQDQRRHNAQISSSCVANPDKVPFAAASHQLHGYRTTEQHEDEDDTGPSTELRDTLTSCNAGNHQQNCVTDSLNSQEQISPGLSLLQEAAASSPPPHSYRHSRAYRHFKNPPQPHMCIRTTTETGEEMFINVLSWTRIVIPQEPSDPIPLYGGMRVPPGSPRSPPIVFAVMANPEVLKDSGRHSKDPEERRAMVELMCDFVEAMNPGAKLVRNAVILKDRDISGELKDVWNAVQAQRDREREEQMLHQRQQQQQHYHNLATNATTNGGGAVLTNPAALSTHQTQQQMFSKSMLGEVGEGSPLQSRRLIVHEIQTNENCCSATKSIGVEEDAARSPAPSLSMLAEQLDNKMTLIGGDDDDHQKLSNESQRQENHISTNDVHSNGNECKDFIDSNCSLGGHHKNELNNQLNANNCSSGDTKAGAQNHTNGTSTTSSTSSCMTTVSSNANNADALTMIHNVKATPTSSTVKGPVNVNNSNSPSSTTATTTPTPPIPQAVVVNPPPTKKEKLGGFLPNGCIFPRFTKNSKHKDKEKEGKTKDKEKNVLLSALKKSKDKKSQQASSAANVNQEQQNELNNTNNTSATNSTTNNITANTTMSQQQQSSSAAINNHHHNNIHTTTATTNCLQHLDREMQKLDFNRIENNKFTSSLPTPNIVSSNSSAIAINKDSTTTASSSNTNNTGVGVH